MFLSNGIIVGKNKRGLGNQIPLRRGSSYPESLSLHTLGPGGGWGWGRGVKGMKQGVVEKADRADRGSGLHLGPVGQRLWTLALILGVQGLVTQMVSWHYTLYCASFKGFGRLWCLCHCHTLPNSPTSTCKGSKLFLPVSGHPALNALSQGPAGTLTETHIQTLLLGVQDCQEHSLALAVWAPSFTLSFPLAVTQVSASRMRRAREGGSPGAASHLLPVSSPRLSFGFLWRLRHD